jgi:hypothetical protein
MADFKQSSGVDLPQLLPLEEQLDHFMPQQPIFFEEHVELIG